MTARAKSAVQQARDVPVVAVEPALGLDEIEEKHARECRECEGVTMDPGVGGRQSIGQPLEGRSEGAEESGGDAFAGEDHADS